MKLVKIALGVLAAAAAWSPARAAQHLTIEGASGIFRDSFVGCTGAASCLFTTTFTFDAPTGFQLVGGDISSSAASTLVTDPSNIDLDSVTLNGVEFDLDEPGQFEYGYLISTNLLDRGNRLVVTGTTYGQGAFAGTLAFAQAPVPEPATWAMMIVGFGAIGGALRRARRRRPLLA
jgi:hypothetical protein